MMAATVGAMRAEGAIPGNTLPSEAWAARVTNQDTPPSSNIMLWGYYPSPGEAFIAADQYAVSHGPLLDKAQRMFSTGLVEALPGMTVEFDPDPDRDGEIDTRLYTESLSQFGASPRNCSVGDGAAFRTGFSISSHAGLVYEPAEGVMRTPGPLIKGLCERVYCQGASGCSGQGEVDAFLRRAVATFRVTYEPAKGLCDTDRKLVFEDLLGRSSGGQSCEVVGGLNPGANLGGDCPALANGSNPVNTVTGNKYQRESDYGGTVHGELAFVRYYNSLLTAHHDMGLGWRHSYSTSLTVTTARNGDQSARLTRADGRVLVFNRPVGKAVFGADALTVGSFRALPGANVFEYTDGDDVRERFELAVSRSASRGTITHLLLSNRHDPRSGRRETLVYDQRRLLSAVQGRFGRTLGFVHDAAGRLRTMTDASGRRYSYEYDRLGHLTSVTYPDLDDHVDDVASRANNPVRVYRYDDPDWPKGLTDIVDESGAVFAHWDYDKLGRALSSEHAGGVQRVAFDYQAAYTAITDAFGHTRSYNTQVESGVGLISAVSGGDCNFCGAGPLASTTYDGNGQRNLVTDHAGNVTDFDYDAGGLLLRKSEGIGAEQRVTTTTWLANLRLPATVSVADGAGRLVSRTRNDYWGAQLKRQTEEELLAGGAARVTTYEYFGEEDANDPRSGLLKSVDGPRSDVLDVTRYDYDAVTGNLVSVTNALGHVTRYTAHDAEGRALTEVDANGVETRFQYDARGHLLSRTVDGAETRMEYDARGLLIATAFADGSTQHYGYDAAQRLVRVTNGTGTTVEYSLDALGNRIEERYLDSAGATVSRQARIYNRQNQLEQLIGGAGQTTTFAYDDNGRLQTIGDPRGGGLSAQREYDSLGRETASTDNLGAVTRTQYDHQDQVVAVTDPRGLVTTYSRDGLGNALETVSPDAGRSRDEYDAAGNRVRHVYQQKPGIDIAIGYQFDALNRLTKIDYPNDADVIYGYDEGPPARNGMGRLTSMRDASGLTTMDYDARGHLRRRLLASPKGSFELNFEVGGGGFVTQVRYPGSVVVDVTRDSSGRVVAVAATRAGATLPIASEIGYHALGGISRLRFGNGLVESRDYYQAGRLAAINSSAANLPSYRYPLYDAANNLLRIEGAHAGSGALRSDVRSFSYDAGDRLVAEDSTLRNERRTYGYDANGNRTDYQVSSLGGTSIRTERFTVESTSNRIHGSAPRADDYDAAGNMTREVRALVTSGSGTVTTPSGLVLTYNDAGRVQRTTTVSGYGILDAVYNGLGQRAMRTSNSGVRSPDIYLYGQDGELMSVVSRSEAGKIIYQNYVWLDGRPIAEVVVIPSQSSVRVNYIHVNQVNQPLYMTGASGALTWAWIAGDAFGQDSTAVTDPDGDGIREAPQIGGLFAGQVRETPYVSNGFRDYDAKSGRYIESDPIGLAGGLNPYAYVGGNPVNSADPYGLTQCDIDVALEYATKNLTGKPLPDPDKRRLPSQNAKWCPPAPVVVADTGNRDFARSNFRV
ncbi:MAG: RHS repeat protein [Proteobacteria bacterium]|nr:RHS repeat protein [Pseudomonadota bacterium]